MSNKGTVCFKAYDIRGRVGIEFNNDIAFKIGYAVAKSLKTRKIIIGYDARESSPSLSSAAQNGVRAAGSDIINIGLSGTEEMYCAVTMLDADAGIIVTASHNPIDYNGMKIVKSGSRPLSEEEFLEIKMLVKDHSVYKPQLNGKVFNKGSEARNSYIKTILKFVDLQNLKPLKILINSGNGAAGPVIDNLEKVLQTKNVESNFIKLLNNPDSSFPSGIPNPLIPENRIMTTEAILRSGASFGVAFDGDFDRCFFFDDLGDFVPSILLVFWLKIFFANRRNDNS